jgi:hypothetical protein
MGLTSVGRGLLLAHAALKTVVYFHQKGTGPLPAYLVTLLTALVVGSGLLSCKQAEAAGVGPLILERTIPLDQVAGRIDHLAVDLGRHRLFVAELGNHTIDVIDLVQAKSIQRLEGLGEPQGIGYVPKLDRIVVADGADGRVHLYRGEDLKPAGILDLGDDADNVRLGPKEGQVTVGYGSGGLAIIDVVNLSLLGEVKLAGHPEGFRLDPQGKRAFVNIPDAQQIAVVNLAERHQSATWTMKGRRSNFPMAINEDGSTIASVFRSPAQLVLFATITGSPEQELATCGDADDVFFDAKRQRIYVSCGAGVVDVFESSGHDYRRVASVETSSGARTSLFVPELDRLFVAARAGSPGSPAKILVFRPMP